VHTTS